MSMKDWRKLQDTAVIIWGDKVKIRNSFVTNSSSASYVLGKAGDDSGYDRESVYQLMRGIFLDFIREIAQRYEENRAEFEKLGAGLEYGRYFYKFTGPKEARFKLFDIMGWDFFSDTDISPWIEKERYEECEEYMYSHDREITRDYIAFRIIDLSEPIDGFYIEDIEEVVDWYDLDVEPQYLGAMVPVTDCTKCGIICCQGRAWFDNRDTYDENDEYDAELYREYMKCQHLRELFREGRLENTLVEKIGKVIVFSWDDFLPGYVHDRLQKIARYGCCHMG